MKLLPDNYHAIIIHITCMTKKNNKYEKFKNIVKFLSEPQLLERIDQIITKYFELDKKEEQIKETLIKFIEKIKDQWKKEIDDANKAIEERYEALFRPNDPEFEKKYKKRLKIEIILFVLLMISWGILHFKTNAEAFDFYSELIKTFIIKIKKYINQIF